MIGKKGLLERLKKLHAEYFDLSERRRIIVGIGDDYIQLNSLDFVMLAKDSHIESKWNGKHLHLETFVEGLKIITLLMPSDVGEGI